MDSGSYEEMVRGRSSHTESFHRATQASKCLHLDKQQRWTAAAAHEVEQVLPAPRWRRTLLPLPLLPAALLLLPLLPHAAQPCCLPLGIQCPQTDYVMSAWEQRWADAPPDARPARPRLMHSNLGG